MVDLNVDAALISRYIGKDPADPTSISGVRRPDGSVLEFRDIAKMIDQANRQSDGLPDGAALGWHVSDLRSA